MREFVLIPGGEFEMGSNDSEAFDIEKPPHRVKVAEFRIGKAEVTQAQWLAVMGSNPSRVSGCDLCPVEKVSWDDVQKLIQRLGAQTDLPLRLPTEAEWEYAARGGARQQRWVGTDNQLELGTFAWYDVNSDGRTHPVCQKLPNVFGLCDMTGNVFEWVGDRYDQRYDDKPTPDSTEDPTAVHPRVLRGGGWGYSSRLARTAYRGGDPPSTASGSIGFRLAFTDAQH